MAAIIDAHHHFWDRERFTYPWQDAPALAPIRRTFLPGDLKRELDAVGVGQTVFVQVQHTLEENRWVLGLAEQHPWLAGVVGWVDLASPDVEEQVAEFRRFPKFVGVRHITQDEPDNDFIVRPQILRGLRVLEKHRLPFDLLFYVKHLRHAVTLARELPELPMVIDHLAKPEIRAGRLDGWEADFRAAAKCPNLVCKLSGMITEAKWDGWTADDLKPFVRVALEAFGPSRLMYGSDWPVCLLAGSYAAQFDALNEALGPLSGDERDDIFRRTAAEFYGLRV